MRYLLCAIISLVLCDSVSAQAYIYSTDVNTTGLIAWYKLNESVGSNTCTDSSGQGNHGTTTGATQQYAGAIGKCYNFDGDDYLRLTDINTLDSNIFSITCWVLLNSTESTRYIFSKQTGAGPSDTGISLMLSSGSLRFDIYDTQRRNYNIGTGALANVWYLIAVTYDNTSLKCYSNAIRYVNTTLPSSYSPAGSQIFTVGARSYNIGSYLIGLVDDVRIYSRVLSAVEISNLYADGRCGISR